MTQINPDNRVPETELRVLLRGKERVWNKESLPRWHCLPAMEPKWTKSALWVQNLSATCFICFWPCQHCPHKKYHRLSQHDMDPECPVKFDKCFHDEGVVPAHTCCFLTIFCSRIWQIRVLRQGSSCKHLCLCKFSQVKVFAFAKIRNVVLCVNRQRLFCSHFSCTDSQASSPYPFALIHRYKIEFWKKKPWFCLDDFKHLDAIQLHGS